MIVNYRDRKTERFANGETTREELAAARAAAWAARAAADAIDAAWAAIDAWAANAAAWAAYYTARALNIDIKVYYDKLIKMIESLTETEKMIYNINLRSI